MRINRHLLKVASNHVRKLTNSPNIELGKLTFNILISFPKSDCDLARFFLLMHFTATSKWCFYG